jgi:hypothetical protein
MSGKGKKGLIIVAAAVVVIAALIAGKGYISSRAYFRAADRLSSTLPADLQAKYGGELKDTTDKFWNCYEQEICSRNDMTDVMDYMKRLTAKGDISDMEIFEFIGFVSRIYTDRLDAYHRKTIKEMEEKNQQDQ